MGWASEAMIAEHNALMENDEYAEEYFMQMAMEEAFYEARELELERYAGWFDDQLIDFRGEPVELPAEPEIVLIDDDIPF